MLFSGDSLLRNVFTAMCAFAWRDPIDCSGVMHPRVRGFPRNSDGWQFFRGVPGTSREFLSVTHVSKDERFGRGAASGVRPGTRVRVYHLAVRPPRHVAEPIQTIPPLPYPRPTPMMTVKNVLAASRGVRKADAVSRDGHEESSPPRTAFRAPWVTRAWTETEDGRLLEACPAGADPSSVDWKSLRFQISDGVGLPHTARECQARIATLDSSYRRLPLYPWPHETDPRREGGPGAKEEAPSRLALSVRSVGGIEGRTPKKKLEFKSVDDAPLATPCAKKRRPGSTKDSRRRPSPTRKRTATQEVATEKLSTAPSVLFDGVVRFDSDERDVESLGTEYHDLDELMDSFVDVPSDNDLLCCETLPSEAEQEEEARSRALEQIMGGAPLRVQWSAVPTVPHGTHSRRVCLSNVPLHVCDKRIVAHINRNMMP